MKYPVLIILLQLVDLLWAQHFLTEQTSAIFPPDSPPYSSNSYNSPVSPVSLSKKYLALVGYDIIGDSMATVYRLSDPHKGTAISLTPGFPTITSITTLYTRWYNDQLILAETSNSPLHSALHYYDLSNPSDNVTGTAIITTPSLSNNSIILLVWNDLNQDGIIDIIVRNSSQVYLVDAANYLVDQSIWLSPPVVISNQFSAGGSFIIVMEVLDYDRDGTKDLIVCINNYFNNTYSLFQLKIYRQTGNLVFTDVTNSTLPSLPSYNTGLVNNLFIRDLDNDGDVDIIIMHSSNRKIMGLRNNGANYEDITTSFGNINLNFNNLLPYWFDYNGDGLMDLFYTGTFGIAINFYTMYLQNVNGEFSRMNNELLFPAGRPNILYNAPLIWDDFNNDSLTDLYMRQSSATGLLYLQGCSSGYYLDQTRPLTGCILCQGTVSSDQFGCTPCSGQDYFNSTLGCIPCPSNSIPTTDRLNCQICPPDNMVKTVSVKLLLPPPPIPLR